MPGTSNTIFGRLLITTIFELWFWTRKRTTLISGGVNTILPFTAEKQPHATDWSGFGRIASPVPGQPILPRYKVNLSTA